MTMHSGARMGVGSFAACKAEITPFSVSYSALNGRPDDLPLLEGAARQRERAPLWIVPSIPAGCSKRPLQTANPPGAGVRLLC